MIVSSSAIRILTSLAAFGSRPAKPGFAEGYGT